MTEATTERVELVDGGEIVFHFDVESHAIPIKQFIATARNAQAIVDSFNAEIFDGKVKLELYASSPETGGVIETFKVVIAVTGTVWAIGNTEIGKGLINGLTGRDPYDWAVDAGKGVKSTLQDVLKEKQPEPAQPDGKDLEEEDFLATTDEITIKNVESKIIADMVVSFVATPTEGLEKLGLSPNRFRKAYQAKNQLIRGCIENDQVKGLGFSRTHEFPLQRNDFPGLIAEIPREIVEEIIPRNTWNFETQDLSVNSPDWDQGGRNWRAKTSSSKEISFVIEDEAFWKHVDVKDIQPRIKDNLQVQLAYPASTSMPQSVRVLKVLSYNGKKLADPLSAEKMAEFLGDVPDEIHKAPDLLNYIDSEAPKEEPEEI